eukprot:COSAG02_NODE_28624_length_586_cov_0.638604_1_plen_34_part_10
MSWMLIQGLGHAAFSHSFVPSNKGVHVALLHMLL